MVVLFEFLGKEPIENVVTCLNFRIDKVVYFGYAETIAELKDSTVKFLEDYCGVSKVVFHPVSQSNLQSVLTNMRKEIAFERSNGAKTFFDITGGESLVLVAFGMLTKEFDAPMHFYDIPEAKLIELDSGSTLSISKTAKAQKVDFDPEKLIRLHGGTINENLQKSVKVIENDDFDRDATEIWNIATANEDLWNSFCNFVGRNMVPHENLHVCVDSKTIDTALREESGQLKTAKALKGMLDTLAEKGLIRYTKTPAKEYDFYYKSDDVKGCLFDAGAFLELHVLQEEMKVSSSCRAGVHIDWDGVIHTAPRSDVLNEIDVLSLTGYIPTFISCKSGNLKSSATLHALYELETIASAFGGKYVKKVLVTTKEPEQLYVQRAKEMGITIRTV